MSTHRSELLRIDATGVFVCIVITAGAYFGGVRPALDSRTSAVAAAAEIIEIREDNGRVESKLKASIRSVEGKETGLREVAVALKPATEVNQQIARLADLADASDLAVENVLPGSSTVDRKVTQVQLRLSGRGSFVQILSFMRDVRQQLPDTVVSGISVRGQPRNRTERPTFGLDLIWHAIPAAPTTRDGRDSPASPASDRAGRAARTGDAPR